MIFKELKNKYKDYNILVFGRPLHEQTIPFTHLPKDKKLDDCEIIEMKKIDKEFIQTGVSFKTMKPTKSELKKGHIYVYVK